MFCHVEFTWENIIVKKSFLIVSVVILFSLGGIAYMEFFLKGEDGVEQIVTDVFKTNENVINEAENIGTIIDERTDEINELTD